MSTKRAAILFLFLAYAILLGHSIIPHHHHDNPKELADHHNTHRGHDSENEGLGHLLSHLFHSADGFTFSSNHNIANEFSKQQFSLVAVLPKKVSITEFFTPPLLIIASAEQHIYISPHSHRSALRAPPATFI